MALYAIADLHLSFGTKKPMDIFEGWKDYVGKLSQNWTDRISDGDTVVIPGDISWAMNISEAEADFRFIHNLPGKKIILKGNHDYWFTTKSQFDLFRQKHGFDSMQILHNNAYFYEDYAICGTRGWINCDIQKADVNHDSKILAREASRLELSIKDGIKKGANPIVFLHYPPIFANNIICKPVIDVLHKYGVESVFYGHLHGKVCRQAYQGDYEGINFKLISGDYLEFCPMQIM